MNEPDNHTAWVDRFGSTWVRTDDAPGTSGPWWPLTDIPGEGLHARMVYAARSFEWADVVDLHGPLVQASPDRTVEAVDAALRVAGVAR